MEIMKLNPKNILMFNTLLKNSSVSNQIHWSYKDEYKDNLLFWENEAGEDEPIVITTKAKGEESMMYNQSIIEYAPNSDIASQYYHLSKSIAERFISDSKNTLTHETEVMEAI